MSLDRLVYMFRPDLQAELLMPLSVNNRLDARDSVFGHVSNMTSKLCVYIPRESLQ